MLNNDYPPLTLSSIKGGALEEKFQIELEKVMRNIRDPNASDGKREITIKLVFSPNSKGTKCVLDVATVSKLQPDATFSSEMWIAMQGAKPVAVEDDPEQLKLPMQKGDISEVENLPKISIYQR